MSKNVASGIIHEDGCYHVRIDGRGTSYEIYRQGPTSAVRCAIIGLSLGMDRVRAEIARRQTCDLATAKR